MMKKFEAPELELIRIEASAITASGAVDLATGEQGTAQPGALDPGYGGLEWRQ